MPTRALHLSSSTAAWRHQMLDPLVTVSLVTAACLLVEAVIAKNVLDVELGLLQPVRPTVDLHRLHREWPSRSHE